MKTIKLTQEELNQIVNAINEFQEFHKDGFEDWSLEDNEAQIDYACDIISILCDKLNIECLV